MTITNGANNPDNFFEKLKAEQATNNPKKARPLKQRRYSLDCGTEGGADQAAKDECNINHILAMHAQGQQAKQAPGTAHYGDFSEAVDLAAAYDLIFDAEEAFGDLPSSVREAAMNNPVLFAEMLQTPDGQSHLSRAGLPILDPLARPAEKTAPEGTQTPQSQSPKGESSPAAQPGAEPAKAGGEGTPST